MNQRPDFATFQRFGQFFFFTQPENAGIEKLDRTLKIGIQAGSAEGHIVEIAEDFFCLGDIGRVWCLESKTIADFLIYLFSSVSFSFFCFFQRDFST